MTDRAAFTVFFETAEPLVRRALVSRFGAEIGRDATAEAFTVAWRSWERVAAMDNRNGYVYRTGERWAARQPKPSNVLFEPAARNDRYSDPDLANALAALSPRQRQAVVLVAGHGLTHREAAELLGCARSSLQNHVERGLARLRTELEADHATR